ncbi:LysR family transcriptional regulator [Paraburkholderia sp. HP33-1]|uniref:LysR family transcriptional regulator n=1 Tax=Paraburkholderia sp. HP33-1 TaxID=2883243 RepID=UPI001F223B27|nr:LysR family transcriptional regulator [Paraburkholderia sp. HP33-1]
MESADRVRAILSFVRAADLGSFAAAARMLGVSSAAVSKNVASLERALGVRLMNRTTRTLTLTSEGAAFLIQARAALVALDAAVDTVMARRVEPGGRVRISTSAAFGRDQLMPALPGLMARHPALSFEVDFDDRRIDLVQEGYDLALRGGQIPDSALVSRPVCRLNMALVASPRYLERYGVPHAVSDLGRHQLLARRFLGGRISPWTFVGPDSSLDAVEPASAVLTVSAPEALIQGALADMGIAQVGVHHAWPHLRAGTLKVVLGDVHHPGSYEMVLQYPHRALMAPRVRATVEYLLDVFARDESLHVPVAELRAFSA